jgi:hypothetical protein
MFTVVWTFVKTQLGRALCETGFHHWTRFQHDDDHEFETFDYGCKREQCDWVTTLNIPITSLQRIKPPRLVAQWGSRWAKRKRKAVSPER